MVWTTSTCPRGGSARTQSLQPWLGKMIARSLELTSTASLRFLPAVAFIHLSTIAVAVLSPDGMPLPLLLTVSGLLLAVLSLSRPEQPTAAAPHITAADADAGRFDAHTLDLERQSQRLVEIADRASRERREAEMRGQLWAELTARMSHELRTPLNAVIGFSDLMNAEIFGPLGHDRYRDYTRHIRESGRNLLKSAEDTLALTSSLGNTDAPMSSIDLDAAIADAWSFFGSDPEDRGIRLDVTHCGNIEILGEQRTTRQILINLLADCLERTPVGGTIHFNAAGDTDVVAITITIPGALPRQALPEAPLALCIARVLLEQQGSGLMESTTNAGDWRAATFLDRASQRDFFTSTLQ